MAFNYQRFRDFADRIIRENGRTITVVRNDQANPSDPTKPWRVSAGTDIISTDVTGVFVEYEKDDFDSSLIKRGDKRVFVAAQDVEDETTGSLNVKIEDYDYILDGGVRWDIMAAEIIEPGALRIVYDVQVRQ